MHGKHVTATGFGVEIHLVACDCLPTSIVQAKLARLTEAFQPKTPDLAELLPIYSLQRTHFAPLPPAAWKPSAPTAI